MNGPFERDDTLWLGDKAKDRISGFQGTIVAITEWLNGCRRITIASEQLFESKVVDNHTFDAEQVMKVESRPPSPKKPTGGPSIAPHRSKDPV